MLQPRSSTTCIVCNKSISSWPCSCRPIDRLTAELDEANVRIRYNNSEHSQAINAFSYTNSTIREKFLKIQENSDSQLQEIEDLRLKNKELREQLQVQEKLLSLHMPNYQTPEELISGQIKISQVDWTGLTSEFHWKPRTSSRLLPKIPEGIEIKTTGNRFYPKKDNGWIY